MKIRKQSDVCAMFWLMLFVLLFTCGLFRISEGKPCQQQQKRQKHKTRCDKYFECVNIGPNDHIWEPRQCEEGLIYEESVQMCVLPDIDWECSLPVENEIGGDVKSKDDNIYGVNNFNNEYFKWLDQSVNQNGRSFNERVGKYELSRDLDENDTHEASGSGSIDTSETQDSIINSQLLHLNELMKNMKRESDDSSMEQLNNFLGIQKSQVDTDLISDDTKFNVTKVELTTHKSVVNQNTTKLHLISLLPTRAPSIDEKIKPQNTVNNPTSSGKSGVSDEVLKLLVQLSQQLLNKPAVAEKKIDHAVSSPQENYLQPIIRPIYITVPIPSPNFGNSNQQNTNGQQNTVPATNQVSYPPVNPIPQQNSQQQSYVFPNISQIPLVDSYGQPISSYVDYQQPIQPYYQSPFAYQSQYPNYFNRDTYYKSNYDAPAVYKPNYLLGQMYDVNRKELPKIGDQLFAYDEEMPLEDTDLYGLGENDSASSEESMKPKKYVDLGGTVFPYDQYKSSILPFIRSSNNLNDIQVLTCASGARQANKTDCTKYFVCNPQSGGIYPFSCPVNTAFNDQTKYCDIKTYQECKKSNKNKQEILSNIVQKQRETTRLQYETLKAIEELKRIKQQTLRLQNMPNYMAAFQTTTPPPTSLQPDSMAMLLSLLNNQNNRVQDEEQVTVTTVRPKSKKRLTCLQPGKVADPDSPYHYYVCFKTPDNFLKLHKMKCLDRFIFCKKLLLCTLPDTCL